MQDYDPDELPDNDEITEATSSDAGTAELLGLCEEFLRTSSPAVHCELRRFLTRHGYHPVCGLGAFLDALQFTVFRPDTAPHSPTSPTE